MMQLKAAFTLREGVGPLSVNARTQSGAIPRVLRAA